MASSAVVPPYENLQYEKKKGVIAYVTVNRPKVLNVIVHALAARCVHSGEGRSGGAGRDPDRRWREGVDRRSGYQ